MIATVLVPMKAISTTSPYVPPWISFVEQADWWPNASIQWFPVKLLRLRQSKLRRHLRRILADLYDRMAEFVAQYQGSILRRWRNGPFKIETPEKRQKRARTKGNIGA